MTGVDVTIAQTHLDEALAAHTAVMNNQEYRIANRTYRRADLKDIQASITYWDKQVKSLTRGGLRVIGATPLD